MLYGDSLMIYGIGVWTRLAHMIPLMRKTSIPYLQIPNPLQQAWCRQSLNLKTKSTNSSPQSQSSHRELNFLFNLAKLIKLDMKIIIMLVQTLISRGQTVAVLQLKRTSNLLSEKNLIPIFIRRLLRSLKYVPLTCHCKFKIASIKSSKILHPHNF